MKCANIRNLALLLGLMSLSACFNEADVDVADTKWRVESLGESTHPFADGVATVAFDDERRIMAYSGCNRMAGEYAIKGGVITISQLMSTKMACMPAQKMYDEAALAGALAKVTVAQRVGDKLTLSGAGGVVIMLWKL